MLREASCIQNEEVFLPLIQEREIQLFIKREDKIHPEESGNKLNDSSLEQMDMFWDEAKKRLLQKEITF